MIRLLTKKNENVKAYNDTVIFHARLGDYDTNEPYGIIKSQYDNPFLLTFSGTKIFINPGILSCYGREVEINEKMEVIDLSSYSENRTYFVNVYIEINLEDITNELATFRVHITGANFEPITSVYRDNLYSLAHGIYLVPIGRVEYNPSRNPVFSNNASYIHEYDDECVNSAEYLGVQDSIAEVPLYNLAETYNIGLIRNLKFLKADNTEALAHYEENGYRGEYDPFYSVAEETKKIGNVVMPENGDFPFMTAHRIDLFSIGSISFAPTYSKSIKFKFNSDNAKLIRIFLEGSGAKLKLKYRERKDSIFGQGTWHTCTMPCDFALPSHEILFKLPSRATQFSVYFIGHHISEYLYNDITETWSYQQRGEVEFTNSSPTTPFTNQYFYAFGDINGAIPNKENTYVERTVGRIEFRRASIFTNERTATFYGDSSNPENSNGDLHWQYLAPEYEVGSQTIFVTMDVIYNEGVSV